jgi:MoaA/NifB/PqqE/SkfB family radical SAM enzyme
MGEFIPFTKLRKLENVFSRVKVFCVSSSIGEPLLHPELEEILAWLYTINPSILLQIVTNGTTLTAGKAGFFAGHLDWLSISLNAANGEAHMRDMFPHLVKRGINAEKRWALHVCHLTEFLAALPPSDRRRVKFQMVTHRHNVRDVVDFVRLVKKMGGSHAVVTNIAVHPDTVDWSLYWVKDQYNDVIDEACEVGSRLGVQVHAARFYTTVKPVLDLDKACRDPLDVAYISRSSKASPCCHWTETQIPVDFYEDENGFEEYWNSNLLRQLRHKRDFASCQLCGMSRVFDETSFHFSPKLKQALIAGGRLSEFDSENDYPDAKLVARCIASHVDLPSIRRTLLGLDLPVALAAHIADAGLDALPDLDRACWAAFQETDMPFATTDIPLAGRFLGIGWGPPIHEPDNNLSARPLGGAQVASVFVRAEPAANCEVRFTLHQASPLESEPDLDLEVCGRRIAARYSRDEANRTVLSGIVPDDIWKTHGGRLWVRVGCLSDAKRSARRISFVRFEVSDTRAIEATQSKRSRFARSVLTVLAAHSNAAASPVDQLR